MRQVVQNLKTGAIELAEIPAPAPRPGEVLLRNQVSLISAGTERSTIASGRQSLLERARKRPEKVIEVLGRVRRDGLGKTIESVQAAFERLQPMGYCSVGTVIGLGEGVRGFQLGDRVASNAPHAELATVAVNLCARVPDDVDDAAAAFTVLGAIALQGLRLAQPTLGECFAVTGLGVVGLLAVQLLRAQGVRVLAIDPVERRRQMAASSGAVAVTPDDAEAAALALSRSRGLDGVLIATATDSDAPVHQAAQMCRKRGRLVMVGVSGLGLARADFYEKELSFQVSASYGPGRYDPAYEQQGQDYPAAFVRWTAGRNFEAVLDMLADRRLDVAPLISARLPIDRARDAYGMIDAGGATLGVLFEYPQRA
ncbi:MAG: zinc-binding alcohol dehydrogenase, partial [Alphaproteobacteria bacterium]|nr:zinc-binding alcohol dehydrogenase [Alphaproteobacteria bacterium]